jgi:sulfatase maturation enzyme AslB (radical SAM superfamily)
MCNRNVNGGKDNPLIKIHNWSLSDFKKIINPEVLSQIDNFYLCGNFGDPILNNDLIDMCQYSKETAPNVKISVHTNGGVRNTDWWQKLAYTLPTRHNVVFAIDGLEDTHKLYRVGTDWHKIIHNAWTFIQAGGTAEWVFIKFEHNEHQVELARIMAEDLGFKKFTVKNSSRFILEPKVDVLDRKGQTTHSIKPASDVTMKFIDKKIIQAYKQITENSEINCKVLKDK